MSFKRGRGIPGRMGVENLWGQDGLVGYISKSFHYRQNGKSIQFLHLHESIR